MASKHFEGQLLEPIGDTASNDKLRFTHTSTTGQTIGGAQSVVTIDAAGFYNFDLEYGIIQVEYFSETANRWRVVGSVTINSDITATTITALLNAVTPATPELVLELQQILSDADQVVVDAQNSADAAAQSATDAANSAVENGKVIKSILVSEGLSGEYGYFADGFTINDPLDVGIDASFQFWKYVGSEALPYDAPPLTDPSAGDWELVRLNDHSRDINRNADGAHVASAIDTDYGTTVAQELKSKKSKDKNTVNFAEFYRKIQSDNGLDTITICCRGDSLTYGEDTTVDPQPVDPVITPSGRSHTQTRASTPYPQALDVYLQPLFNNTVEVINQGYSGDNTQDGFSDWNVDLNQDLTIIMYGTNDAAFGFSPYQTIEDFVFYYRKIIEREINNFNSAVILITPPPQKQLNANTRLLESYRNAVFSLGNEYGCPVIDGAEIFRGIDSTLFSDNVHFRTLGYQWLASNIQARILAKKENYAICSDGSNMTVRFPEDGIKARFSNWGTQTAKSNQVTPPLTSFTGGYVIETSSYFEKFVFAFYCDKDDTIVIPNIEVANATFVMQLNNGIWQPQYTFDDRVQNTGNLTGKPPAYYEYSVLDNVQSINRNSPYEIAKPNRIHIAAKGWYTLTLYIKSNGSVGSPRLTIGGVNFESYETVEMWDRHFYGLTGTQKPLGNVTPRYVGQFYIDTSTGIFAVWVSIGSSNASWKLISDQTLIGSGSPNGVVTPYHLAQKYIDTSAGQFNEYTAVGLTNTSWKQTT